MRWTILRDHRIEAVEAPGPRRFTKKQLEIFRSLLRKAGNDDKSHHVHLKDLFRSDQVATGRVSQETYASILGDRRFDRYCRQLTTTKSEEEKIVDATTKKLKEFTAKPPKPHEVKQSSQRKPKIFGPPGLRDDFLPVLESEGNEKFYRGYEGPWKNGTLHGLKGTYKFADGATYTGPFAEGQPHGDEGKALYPSTVEFYEGSWRQGKSEGPGTVKFSTGSSYQGEWKDGRRHGKGTLEFPKTGVTYSGEFESGKFHGRGILSSPATGISFDGTFHRGFINGPGTLTVKKVQIRNNWVRYGGYASLKDLVDAALEDHLIQQQDRQAVSDALFGVKFALQLQDYVDKVKDDLKDTRDQAKADAEALRRAKIRERKEKIQQAKNEALEALASAADRRSQPSPL